MLTARKLAIRGQSTADKALACRPLRVCVKPERPFA